jgi:hypothetical protein
MKIELFSNNTDSFPWGFFVLWSLIWLAFLYRILTRSDFDTPSRILWTMVVIFVPFFGVALYWAAAPPSPSPVKARAQRKADGTISESDVAGTPWADNPGFTNDK